MLNPDKQSRIGSLITWGIVLAVLGAVFAFFVALGVGLFLSFCGLMMSIFGLLLGLRAASGTSPNPTLESEPDCQIIARFCLNPQGDMMFDTDPDTSQELRYFVQVAFPGGRRGEFRCPPEVYFHCGEGLRGSAEFQEDWLGRFSPFPPGSKPEAPLI